MTWQIKHTILHSPHRCGSRGFNTLRVVARVPACLFSPNGENVFGENGKLLIRKENDCTNRQNGCSGRKINCSNRVHRCSNRKSACSKRRIDCSDRLHACSERKNSCSKRFSNALRNTRDALAIREKLLAFIFKISPADRTAILLMDREGLQFETLSGRDRRDPARSIRVSRTIAECVYKDGM